MVANPAQLSDHPDADAERADQERLVERWLDAHPWSTVPATRDGIAAETGLLVERVQARIQAISKRRRVETRPADHGRKA